MNTPFSQFGNAFRKLKIQSSVYIIAIMALLSSNVPLTTGLIYQKNFVNKWTVMNLTEWSKYHDKYWAFDILYPKDWEVQNFPYKGFGFQISSPDIVLDPIGRPLNGAYLRVSVWPVLAEKVGQLPETLQEGAKIFSQKKVVFAGHEAIRYSGLTYEGSLFININMLANNYYYNFSFLTAEPSKDEYLSLADSMLSSVALSGTPVSYPAPDYASMGINLTAFNFPPIRHAFTFGPGKIISGYGHQTGSNQYALDFCEGDQCTKGNIGDYVLAPTNITLTWSGHGYGMSETSKDLHIFEISNDGQNKLCMQIGHLEIRVPGFNPGKQAPQGAAIGTLINYSSIPHLHMSIWTVPSSYICETNDYEKRVAVAFEGVFRLDGVDYKPGEDHKGITVISTNHPFCWIPTQQNGVQNTQDFSSSTSESLGCFPNPPIEDIIPPSGKFTEPTNGTTVPYSKVTISVDATDNQGGSGIKEVRFSAAWGGQWTSIGTDSSAPYSIEWDMCSFDVPDVRIDLGMEIWDNAGNQFVWSRDSGVNPYIEKRFDCSGTVTQGGYWDMWGWQNKDLAGFSNLVSQIQWDQGRHPYIDFDWKDKGPEGLGAVDNFSVRLQRQVDFQGGKYDFYCDVDDGIKIFIDGVLFIDKWWDGHKSCADTKTLSAGKHTIKVEQYEHLGDALLHVWWYGPGYLPQDTQIPDGRIIAPSEGFATKDNPLLISGEAWDDVSGVDNVSFYAWYCLSTCDWHLLSTIYSPPYEVLWDWSSLPDLNVSLRIDITDKTGLERQEAGGIIKGTLDQGIPSVEIISPEDYPYLNKNQILIQANAFDNASGVVKLRFDAGYGGGGMYWHTIGWDETASDGWQLSWNTTGIADQYITLLVFAYDQAGNVGTYSLGNLILDRTSPTSSVSGLNPNNPPSFIVSWTGTDDVSGVASYDIQYQDNGASWTDWVTNETELSGRFLGTEGHTYAFRSRARDKAGNVEPWSTAPDTQTTINKPPLIPGDANSDGMVDGKDYIVWLNNFARTDAAGPQEGDFNSDKLVDGKDYIIWMNNYNG